MKIRIKINDLLRTEAIVLVSLCVGSRDEGGVRAGTDGNRHLRADREEAKAQRGKDRAKVQ